MSITDELREWAKARCFEWRAYELFAIADRIDAEYRKAIAELRKRCAAMWLKGYGDFSTALMEGNEAITADFEKAGWVKLPVDADGVPIRIGDVMEWCDSGETLTVEGIGNDVLFYIDGENAEWTTARNKRHHHEPTVEDVLREFVRVCIRIRAKNGIEGGVMDFYVDEEAIAEYAPKFRLAKEGKE